MRRALTAGVVAALALAPAAALAAPIVPGASDPSFGRGGFVAMDRVPGQGPGVITEGFTSMRLLGDDTVQLAGFACGVSCSGRTLVRLTPSGRTRAVVRQQVGAPAYSISGTTGTIDLQNGGSLLAVSSFYPTLALVAPDGALLRNVALPVRFAPAIIAPASIAPGGAVVGLARRTPEGSEPPGSAPDLVRLTPDFGVDSGFGAGGFVPLPPALARVGPLAATADAIRVSAADENGLLLGRFTAAGALVRVGRIAVTDVRTPGELWATQMVVRNGRALVVGRVPRLVGASPSTQSVVVAFRPDGRADRGFGHGGVLRVAEDNARIALQADGRIVVASTTNPAAGPGGRLVLRRFSASGQLDATFPTRRIRTRARLQAPIGIAVDRRARITVAAATWRPPTSGGVLVARFLSGPPRRG